MERKRRRWWTWGLTVATVLVVLAATVSMTFQLVVDAMPGYRERLQDRLTQAVGHPVRIGSMALTWHRLRPNLDLLDVAVLDEQGKPLARLSRLRLGFGLSRLLTADWMPRSVEAVGLQLQADVDALGHWTLRGFGGGGGGGDGAALQHVSGLDRLRLRNCELLVHDPQLSREPLRVGVADASVSHAGARYTLAAKLQPPAELAVAAAANASFTGDAAHPDGWQGQWSLQVDGVHGWPWLAGTLGPGVRLALDGARLNLSGRVEGGRIAEVDAQAAAAAVAALRGNEVLTRVTRVRLEAAAWPEQNAWRSEVRRLEMTGARGAWAPARGNLHYAVTSTGIVLDAGADGLRLDDLAPWAALWKDLPASAGRLADLRGDVHELQLHYEQAADGAAPRYELQARLAGAGLAAAAGQPGFSGLDATLHADQDGGRVSVPQAALQAQLPQAFEQALPLSLQNAEFAWKRGAAGWQVDAPEFGWQVPGASGHSQLGLLLPQDPGASLRLKLATSFKVADILALKPYLPKTWGPGTRDWLQRALQGGRIDQGQLQIDGPLDDYPFVEHPDGQWLLDLDVADGTLAYAPGWPAVEKLQAQLQFRGHGLQISANAGQIGGNVVDRVEARIPDFRDAKLTVDASTHGEAASYYTALRGSPIARKLGGLLTDTEAAGPVAADVHLDILLNQDDPPVSARGAVHLDGGSVQVRGVARPITDLHGDVAFDDHGVRSENLGGQVYGSALSGTIVGEPESPDGVLEAQLDAPAEPADGVLAAFTPDWLRSRFSGTAHIAGRMPFAGPHSGQLTVKTDLRGVALTLPAPLAKPADEPLPLTVTVGEGGPARPAGEPLRILVDAGERLRVALRFARPADGGDALLLRAAEARLGPGEMPRAEEDGVFVRGAPALFEIGDWIGFIDAIDAAPGTQGTAGVAFRGADLSPQKLAYRGISLLQPHLLVAATAGGWGIQLEGANAQGRVDFARADGGRVEVRLQRLSLEPLAPMSRPGEEEHGEPFEPAQAPVLDFACDALKLGAIDLGRVSFVTARVEDGQALQQLSLKGGKLQGSVHGGWTRGAGGSAADLGFDITSDDLGGVLQAFGYARTMDAKDASFSGKLSWPRQPAGLELAQADGTVTLAVHKGSLRAVEPGATRVLGLLNLYALPRRLLSFDFRDVVAKGLVFDSLTGSFKLAEGQAQTGDLKVDSPSMKMQMTGRIGLAARDYDEKITVQPNVTTGVTVGATLLGGPIAGGIALIAQEVFNKPFSALSQFSYRVTGSWDNPQVKAGDKRQAAATPAPADASEVP